MTTEAADKKEIVRNSVKAFGKNLELWGRPFSIGRQRGLYYYVPAEHFDWLRELNEAAGKDGLPAINVVGRGGVPGNRPFALGGGLFVCVLAEHVRQLQEINELMQTAERPITVEKEEIIAPAEKEEERKSAISNQPETAPTIIVQEAVVEKENKGEKRRQTTQESEAKKGRYVYCIIKADDKEDKTTKSFGKIGLGSEEVYCINYRSISAVVSNFEGIECKLSEENARVHNGVISRAMELHGSVLPVGFGTIFASGKILKGVLGQAYHRLKEEMKGVENKVELGVKIVASKQQGEAINCQAPEEALESLSKIAAKTRKGKPFMERMLLNASFLVERSRMDEFTRQVEELEKKYSDAVKLQYTGPWPPYNFVSIRIGAKEG